MAYYKKALYYNWHYADAMYNLGVAYGEMLKFDMVNIFRKVLCSLFLGRSICVILKQSPGNLYSPNSCLVRKDVFLFKNLVALSTFFFSCFFSCNLMYFKT